MSLLRGRPFRALAVVAALTTAACGLAISGAAATPTAGTSGSSANPVTRVPISFTVRNVNRSKYKCASDGKTYTASGYLIGPASAAKRSAVTLYLHGLNFGEFFWDFTAVPGYDYAVTQARSGQTSVVIDRLGYGASGKPGGFAVCAGSRADIAHQMVQDLRSGHYQAGHRAAPRFSRVALAGHSYGGQIAELEAYSFGDINALAVISYTDQGASALAQTSATYSTRVCAAGSQAVAPGGPGGYAPFGDPAGAKAALFNDVDPAVLKAALPKLTLNPCADMTPFAAVSATNLKHLKDIRVPVLVISGGADALFPPAAAARQATLYTGSPRVQHVTVPKAAHAITLERTRGIFAGSMNHWLRSVLQ